MIKDLREFAPYSEIEADLCVVGAGAAGIALAREFEGSNVQVILLESGGFSHENNTHALSEGESVGLKHTGLTDGRGRLLGGTTRLWAGQCMPLDEIDFEAQI